MKNFPVAELRDLVARAKGSPFYSARLSGAVTWESIPFTTKEDLRSAYPFGLLAIPQAELATYHESSGTSGKVVSSYFSETDWKDIASRFLRSRVQLSKNDMVLIKTPYALVTTAHQMQAAANFVGATVVPADNRSALMPYSRVLRLLKELPISVSWSLPTEALMWAYLARSFGYDPKKDFPHLRALWVAGESLSPARQRAISAAWGGKDVVQDYGSTETGSLAGECSQGHLHFWADRIYAEILRDNGELASTGEGTLVLSPLYREAMPLLRYNTEDRVDLTDTPCACGSQLPRIKVLGRQDQSVREIEEALYSVSGVWFWRARKLGGETNSPSLEVEVYAEEEATEALLKKSVEDRCNVTVSVRKVAASSFIPEEWLRAESAMQKPRYLFSEKEQWRNTLAY